MSAKIGRNDPCPCSSGKKFKRCCKDIATATKVFQLNEIARELFIDRAQKEDPVGFAHEHRQTAYHEAGHALMEMLFYRDLNRVSILPCIFALKGPDGFRGGRGICEGIDHNWKPNDEDAALHAIEMVAILSAGKIAASVFCTCDTCTKGAQANGDEDGDQERIAAITGNAEDKHVKGVLSATAAAIQRHRPQLDAIVEALIEHQNLSGDEVLDAMLATGWDPETDSDPEQFYDEALGIAEHHERSRACHEAGHALLEVLFYRDVRRVAIVSDNDCPAALRENSDGYCTGIYDDDIGSLEERAICLAGKAAENLFCACELHAGGDSKDQEGVAALTTEVKVKLSSAVAAVLERHRAQLDAIAHALVARKSMSGSEVREVMLASGWNPDIDADPAQFYNEVLDIIDEAGGFSPFVKRLECAAVGMADREPRISM